MDKYDFYKGGYDVDDGPDDIGECVICGKTIWQDEYYFDDGSLFMCDDCYNSFAEVAPLFAEV